MSFLVQSVFFVQDFLETSDNSKPLINSLEGAVVYSGWRVRLSTVGGSRLDWPLP